MAPEHSNESQPFELGQEASRIHDDSLPSKASVDPSLSPMMTSLTSNGPVTSGDSVGDSAPQYPSLEAAVGVEQQAAPTLTNLLAAQTQAVPNLGLGTPGIAVVAVTSDASSAESLSDEQAPLAGQAIAVTQPNASSPAAAPTANSPAIAQAESEVGQGEANSEGTTSTASLGDSAQSAVSSTAAMPAEPNSESAQPSPATEATSPGPVVDETLATVTATDPEANQSAAAQQSLEQPADLKAEDLEAETGPSNSEAVSTQNTEETPPAGDSAENEAEDGAEDSQAENNFDQVSKAATEGDRAQQVLLKREENHVAIILPKEADNANPDVDLDFIDSQIWQDLQQRLSGGSDFASNTPVHLYSQNSLLDTRQLQELDEALGRFNLKLVRIITSRRQTAVAAAMSGYSADQTNNLPELLSKEIHSPNKIGLAEPLYLQKTIRSGVEIRHPGSVIIMGDLNPGSSVIADGDILVWGRLRGIAHAGATGNKTSTIMALKLEATQLRIAGAVARVAAQSSSDPTPEIAYISDKSIRITSAYGFNRNALG